MSTPMPENSLVLFSALSPVMYGVYRQGKKSQFHLSQEQTLKALTELTPLIQEQRIEAIFYASGPGSFTAIKLTHIFLQTLKITQGIELFCTDSFYFNDSAPIRAFGKQFFVKTQEGIKLQVFDEEPTCHFVLPDVLKVQDFGSNCQPLYVLPAV